jgi:Fe-S cluster assembly ATP-binding protein
MENISLVGKTIASMLQKDMDTAKSGMSKMEYKMTRTKMGLIISHTGYILDYVAADKGQVLYNGRLSCVSNPREILKCVGESGYEECMRCIVLQRYGS